LQLEVYKEIEHVTDRLKKIEGVTGVILFGSYSRGEHDEGSDIDLLIIFKDKKALKMNQNEIYKITAETDMFFQAVALTLDELKNSTLLETALREGKIYQAKKELKKLFATTHKPYALISYTTANLNPKERVTFAQELEGRRESKYIYKGLLQKIGGYKVGRGVIMIPLENMRKVTSHFEKKKVDYATRYVWM
jgi:predicted nucleotidyltransferase